MDKIPCAPSKKWPSQSYATKPHPPRLVSVGFVTLTGTLTERTPVLPHALIEGTNQLMVVGPCRAALYKGRERLGARLTKFAAT
jgi:hypothetical protein